MTIGFNLFYAGIITAISFVVSLLLAGTAGSVSVAIPEFLYGSLIGVSYIFNAVALIGIALSLLLFPKSLEFDGVSNNTWNMLYKMDVEPKSIAFSKLFVTLSSVLMIYSAGFILNLLLGFLRASDKSLEIKTLAFLFLVGILSLIVVMMPAFALGSLTRGRWLLRGMMVLTGGATAFILYKSGYFNCYDADVVRTSTSSLISLNPFGLVIIGVICFAAFFFISLSSSASRARSYNSEELDEEALISLGVDESILVLEKDANKYKVIISGPEINDSDIEYELPEVEGFDYEGTVSDKNDKKSASKKPKRSRRRKDEDDAEEE